ncbi:efflux RND transporter periplasmic adaptor subunit [Kordiimonas sp.]|uniref:efflux RND transporter periplasmic adaptor subunit n=1 Tax=Kordiimonas sp. TaxID=1970157 RepID=UPI003A9451B4
MTKVAKITSILILATGILSACSEQKNEMPANTTRPIKPFLITEVASGQIRKYPGVLEATDTSTMSFQLSGNVKILKKNAGDHVVAGEILAVLDKQPFELNVQSAEAEHQNALSAQIIQKQDYDRQKQLFAKGWVSQAAIDKAEASMSSSSSSVDYALSRLGMARRDLANTELRAPFDGTIASKHVQQFQDVSAGQPLLDIAVDGALEAVFLVPEMGVGLLHPGMPVTLTFSSVEGAHEGRITELGTVASNANAFTVRAAVLNPPSALRPGMTSEISVVVNADAAQAGYLIPLEAIVPAERREDGAQVGYVYRVDTDTMTIEKIVVRGAGVRHNMYIVTSGLTANDIIAAAGVSFMHDGQKIRLLNQ